MIRSIPIQASQFQSPAGNGVAFTGDFKLIKRQLATKKSRRPTGTGVAGYAEPTFPAPFDRISDPHIL